jgi:hypothetical protein
MPARKTVRYESKAGLLGWPLVSVAIGPDPAKNEGRGIARGIIAIGDVACGLIAIGGVAGGGIAIGGLSAGLLGIGGVSLGVLILGGVAIGFIATGGVAVGEYARGGAVAGKYVVSPRRKDPEAVRLFEYIPPRHIGEKRDHERDREKEREAKGRDKAETI